LKELPEKEEDIEGSKEETAGSEKTNPNSETTKEEETQMYDEHNFIAELERKEIQSNARRREYMDFLEIINRHSINLDKYLPVIHSIIMVH
jgi:hypothetical protein